MAATTALIQFSATNIVLPDKRPVRDEHRRIMKTQELTAVAVITQSEQADRELTPSRSTIVWTGMTGIDAEYSLYLSARLTEDFLCAT